MPLTYDQRARILRDVILSVPAPASESDEAKEARETFELEKAVADKHGFALEIPFDWENNDPE